MSTILYNLGNIKNIFTKLSLIFFQPTKNELKQEWIYRGEGNANLVISLPNKRQILRIRKTHKSKTFLVWLVDLFAQYLSSDSNCEPAIECQDLKFYCNVMMPLLGCFVSEATPIQISRKQTDDLNRALIQCRPNYRKHKKLKFGNATFFTDFAFLPKNLDSNRLGGATYAVEIKPKQGWLPKNSRKSKCKFCQNQYLKLLRGQIKKISGYCPLDLFSGDKDRMIKAIKSLIYNPQNNFKIFKNGILAYGDQMSVEVFYDLLKEWLQCTDQLSTYSLLEEFSELIYSTLIKIIDKQDINHECIEISNVAQEKPTSSLNSCVYSEFTLPDGCILDRILSVQKLDQLGLDYYKKVAETVTLEKSVDYVERLLGAIDHEKCAKCVINKSIINCMRDDTECRSANELDFVPYLVASVANDCSFMLTYRRINNRKLSVVDEKHVLDSNNASFAVNVGVFDLYPKPMSTIQKHFNRRAKMQKLFHASE